jgi:nitrate reductase gamma subunit
MGKILILAAYVVYISFWIRFAMHALVWWRAARQLAPDTSLSLQSRLKVFALTVFDVALLGRVLKVNPALWLGEWIFHFSFLLVLARHLRYFLDPVPNWVWSMQTTGIIAGYLMPFALLYILVLRLLIKQEKYSATANLFLLGLVLFISSIGVLMHLWLRPDVVAVKLFMLGIMSFEPAAAPSSGLFLLHFGLFLVLFAFLPTHIFSAPFVMMEARKREQELRSIMH